MLTVTGPALVVIGPAFETFLTLIPLCTNDSMFTRQSKSVHGLQFQVSFRK